MTNSYRLLINATITTMLTSDNAGDGNDYGLIKNGAVVINNDRIVWVGQSEDIPDYYRLEAKRTNIEDMASRLLTPGLIDCHTHIVYGGTRAREFEALLRGNSYQQIAASGGGIKATVAATRSASKQQLLNQALARVDRMLDEGVSVIEIKSGYGLDIQNEIKTLEVARQISELRPVKVKTSFLGAHTLPPEWSRKDDYINHICTEMLPTIAKAGLVDAVDGFCEAIAFSPGQIARVFTSAKQLGLPVRLHTDQLSNMGGAQVAADYNALSVDHLEYLDEAGIKAIARSGTVGVLLPGAYYTLRETKTPPVSDLRRHKIPIAVATDCNPGSSPLTSLLLAMNMACVLFRLTPDEALKGTTINAAKALAIEHDYGTVEAGKKACLAVWDTKDPRELCYWLGNNLLSRHIIDGRDYSPVTNPPVRNRL